MWHLVLEHGCRTLNRSIAILYLRYLPAGLNMKKIGPYFFIHIYTDICPATKSSLKPSVLTSILPTKLSNHLFEWNCPMGTGASFPGVKRQGLKQTTHQLVRRSRKRGSIHPFLHTSSWRSTFHLGPSPTPDDSPPFLNRKKALKFFCVMDGCCHYPHITDCQAPCKLIKPLCCGESLSGILNR
jgi:hypothetical protein